MRILEYAVPLAEGEIHVYSDGPAKIIIAVVIIMALWGQKTDRGDK